MVGRVTDVGFDNQTFEAVVTMSIDGRFQFPRDTSAKILTSGLLGEQYIGLSAGGDTANLKDGDTLKITQSAVVLEKLISQFLYEQGGRRRHEETARRGHQETAVTAVIIMRPNKLLTTVALCLALGGCASAGGNSADPLEPFQPGCLHLQRKDR